MKRIKSGLVAMAKQFASLACPVYLLDESRLLLYCNDACEAWTGAMSERLLGRRADFHSHDDDPLTHLVAGLCPPPECFVANEPRPVIVGFRRENGETTRRRARCLPLGVAGTSSGVIVVVEPNDLTADEVAADATTIESSHDRLRRQRSQWQRRYRLDRLVGTSLESQRVRDQAKLAMDARSRVLIVGPPGSGRQHLARTIHACREDAATNTLVPLPCELLDADLLRSTLESLSHKRGPAATLLLLDVDRMNAETQVELARWLLSSKRDVVTLATATIPPLALDSAQFRRDLASALSTLVIELAPLAARGEDIVLLAQMFLEEFNRAGGRQLSGFTPDALKQLTAYPWPNNVTELAAVVEESASRAEGTHVALADLPTHLRLAADAAARPPRKDTPIELDQFLLDVEKELIQRALHRAKGNKAKAARLLGITRPRLHRRMEQFGLE